jgi:hypothetical protein
MTIKYIHKENEKECKIPEVGELWRYYGNASVYMRIDDEEGSLALKHGSGGLRFFYSVCLVSETGVVGEIFYTPKTSADIIKILNAELREVQGAATDKYPSYPITTRGQRIESGGCAMDKDQEIKKLKDMIEEYKIIVEKAVRMIKNDESV